MVTASAIAPHVPCKAALIIKDVAIKLLQVSRLSSLVKKKNFDALESINKWKNEYNSDWIRNYENITEYWTFEYIIHSFKVPLNLIIRVLQLILLS